MNIVTKNKMLDYIVGMQLSDKYAKKFYEKNLQKYGVNLKEKQYYSNADSLINIG